MAGARDEKHIADKYSLDYYRRPLATRVWKSRWNWLALVAAVVISALIFLWRGNSAFWAGPVSDVHASFAMDCGKCHTKSWQPALRLASIDSGRHSVPNAACQECHRAGDHHPRVGETELACAVCHQEHRTDHHLTAIADSQCVRCHGDLTVGSAEPLEFAASIRSFANHPEFTKRTDPDAILFNHAVHLAPIGVLNGNRETVHLECASCHITEPDGRYMAPINYEQHCAECHPLQLEKMGELPHEKPELVLGVLRERLAQMQVEPPAEPAAPQSRDGRPLVKLLPGPTELTDGQAQTAAKMLADAEHAIFGLEAKGFCRQCHHVEVVDGAWHVGGGESASAGGSTTLSQMVPSRWLTHGKFHHEKHRTVACAECHPAAASSKTSDVLLPSIDTCHKCHGEAVATIGAPAQFGVASDCVTCHEYHASVHGGGVELKKLLTILRQE